MKRGILIVMARAPRFGAVKTRLARDIGRLNAWRFYRTTLFETVRRLARNTPWQTVLQVTPDRERSRRRQWPGRAQTLPQGRGDLGARMERGLTGFPRGIPVVLIGSDIPEKHLMPWVRPMWCLDKPAMAVTGWSASPTADRCDARSRLSDGLAHRRFTIPVQI